MKKKNALLERKHERSDFQNSLPGLLTESKHVYLWELRWFCCECGWKIETALETGDSEERFFSGI
jgi:hypothetical protein